MDILNCMDANELNKELKQIDKEMRKLRKGKLMIRNQDSENRIKFYHKTDKTLTYLNKAKRALAEELAYKLQLELEKEIIESRLSMLSTASARFENAKNKYHKYMTNPGFAELLSNYKCGRTDLSKWMHSEYNTNPRFTEKKTHPTVFGIKVRSKSESQIAILLANHSIAFRYECEFVVDGITIYPDFTIKLSDGRTVIWEHLGMLDISTYRKETCQKLETYFVNGYLPGKNLILTAESADAPLTYEQIEATINAYLL